MKTSAMLPAILAVVVLPSHASAYPDDAAAAAALEALRGRSREARAMLAAGPGEGEPPEAAKLVVLASIALDEGDLREAARLAARLRSMRPDAIEGKLLEALVAERKARPRADWIASGLAALQHGPPLTGAAPVLDVWERLTAAHFEGNALPFPLEVTRKLGASDRFLARWAWPHPMGEGPDASLVREAILLAGADERPLVHLAVLDVLEPEQPGRPGANGAEAASARRALVEKMRRSSSGRLRLAALPRSDGTLPPREDEVAGLEAALAVGLRPSFADLYTDLLRILDKVDPAIGPLVASGAAVRVVAFPVFALRINVRIARGDMPESMRSRLATALTTFADSQQRDGLFISSMVGAIALGIAGDLRGDATLRSRARAIREDTEALRSAHRCFEPLLRLPIRSFQRAWASEVPNQLALAQQAQRLGLSCPEPEPPVPGTEQPAGR